MKTSRLLRAFALSLVFAASASLLSAAAYTWNPNSEPSIPNTGGDAAWNSTDTFWRNASGTNVAESSFISDAALTLNFYGTGNITKTGNTAFANGTQTLAFAAGSDYSITGTSTTSIFYMNNGAIFFNVASGASLALSASSGNTLKISSGNATSGGTSLDFSGGGSVTLGANAFIEHNRNANTVINGGTSLTFNSGSLYSGTGASIANPTAYTAAGRFVIENGALNINGGTVITGPIAASSAFRHVGIRVGNSSASSLTVTAGNLTAIGDARGSSTSPSTAAGGIIIGNSSNTNSGGTVNLHGGTVTTTNIQTASTVSNAILSLNGSTIVVSTSTGLAGTAPTDAQRNNFLNQFIAGFANTDASHVTIGSNGITFDTSQVDTTLTGVATIRSDVRGTGGLTKIGNPVLRLSGNNTYTGTTDIQEGKLILNGSVAGNTTVRSAAILSGTGTASDVHFENNSFLLPTSGTFSARNVTINGTLTLQLDLAAGASATFASLSKDGTAFIDLELSNIDPLQTYTLFTVTGTNEFAASDITFTNDLQALGLTAKYVGSNFVLTQIPEPSTYALIAAFAALAFILTRKNRKN